VLTSVRDAVRHTRQHHAIEHATLLSLAARVPGQRLLGYSDPRGFTIFGEVTTEVLRRAVSDALLRLQAGEHQLAIHPNCGTNLAVTALLATSAALIGSAAGRRDPLSRFAGALILVMPALIVGQPLGLHLQQYTTLANVSDRWVKEVRLLDLPGVSAHRVLFE
jgi:hypothetical protein